MSYENPPVPHDVNVSRESVPVEFLRIAAGLAICVVAASAFLYLAGGWLARFIPFSTESGWVGEHVLGIDLLESEAAGNAADAVAIRNYLQSLSERLAARMDLPAGMQVLVHLSDSDVPNAFATLGGHIIITRGLYRRMTSENALALVIAHEIGHVRARDPISAIGGGATLGLILVVLGGDADALSPQIANIVQLGYSRRAESRADSAAVAALRSVYGHAGGADTVFQVLADYQHGMLDLDVPTLLSTHPADAERIAHMRAEAGDWDQRTPLLPLAIAVKEPADRP